MDCLTNCQSGQAQVEASGMKENAQATGADHAESPADHYQGHCMCCFRRENLKLNLRPESSPALQMLSLKIITDNVVLIRRVEILANVQKTCHLRIR